MKYYVFVYGTLRQGCSNHHLLKNAEYIGEAKTAENYALYVDDYPYLYKGHPLCHIRGEVYGVDAQGFSRLDALEGHPVWYQREKRSVILSNGTIMEAWIYFFPEVRGTLVSSGDYVRSDLCCHCFFPG